MKIEREGFVTEHLIGSAEPRWSPAKDGLYSVSVDLKGRDTQGAMRMVTVQLNDLTAQEVQLIGQRYRDGKPLKVTLE